MLSPLVNQTYIKNPFTIFMVIGIAMFATALFGINTRPVSFLATFWLPNPLLLGLFLRFPYFHTWHGWLGAFVGFMLADLVMGSPVALTLALTFANLANVATAILLLKITKLDYNRFNHGLTFFYLFLIIIASSCVGALAAVFTVPYMPGTFMPLDRIRIEFIMWWSGEIQNMILILPIILTWPTFFSFKDSFIENFNKLKNTPKILLPFMVILLSSGLGYYFSGPGALMFPVAGMLWAALTYQFFTITVINLVICSALFHSVTQFYLGFSQHDYLDTTVSARIGIFMMALASLTVALISQNRSILFNQLRHHVDYDTLTQAMSRRNFLDTTFNKLRLIRLKKSPFALLMIDLDYFKRINDTYGHHIGDVTLQHFVKITQQTLRQNDLLGRLGGEEFAIFLADIQPTEALKVAQRIQENLEHSPLVLPDQSILTIHVSIGLYHHTESNDNLEELLSYADQALYKAKALGRNQVYVAKPL